MAVGVTLSGVTGNVVSGSYVICHGISPSIITVEVIPGDVSFSLLNDVVFTDGSQQVVFRDCRLAGVDVSSSPEYGKVWRVTLHDHRWRWQYGYISGTFTEDSAESLAWALLTAMGEANIYLGHLPSAEGPSVAWDYTNPSEALAEIAERYGCLICFNPDTFRVALIPKGIGQALSEGIPHDALDHTISIPDVPAEIVGVCEYTEHEVDLLLEPVGLETDGTIKHIDLLSYRPAGGWGADYLFFENVTAEESRKLAMKSVYRWYRVKGNQAVYGWKPVNTLPELLPISGALVRTGTQIATDGTREIVRKPAYVRGIFDLSTGYEASSTQYMKHPDNFQLDETAGIVTFSRPIFALSGGVVITPTLYLRCVVFSERHTRHRALTGLYGSLPVPCGNIARQIVAPDFVENLGASDNQGDIDSKVDLILELFAKRYTPTQAGQARYIGIWPVVLDGRIQQVSWDVGGDGAFTSVSENSEADHRVPDAGARRRIEKQRSPVASGLSSQEEKAGAGGKGDIPAKFLQGPYWWEAKNTSGQIIPAHSPVSPTGFSDGIMTVSTPPIDHYQAVFFSGPADIPINGFGLVTRGFPLIYHTPLSENQDIGTVSGSFTMSVANRGFRVLVEFPTYSILIPDNMGPDPRIDILQLDHTTTPDASAGVVKLYSKNNDRLYWRGTVGGERQIAFVP